MKKTHIFAVAGLMAGTALFTNPAQARNEYIENALKNRPELSSFYQGLVNTGVINELNEGVSYTIFAPTNDALASLSEEKYPCFYSEQCKGEAADILRNHIVPQEVNFASPGAKGVFSIDKTLIHLGKPARNSFTVDGHNVVRQQQMAGAVLYEIDGVIADAQELSNVSALKYVPMAVVEPQPAVNTTTEKVYYSPEGRPDGISTTTTTTTQTPAVIPVAPMNNLAPAAPPTVVVPAPVIVAPAN